MLRICTTKNNKAKSSTWIKRLLRYCFVTAYIFAGRASSTIISRPSTISHISHAKTEDRKEDSIEDRTEKQAG